MTSMLRAADPAAGLEPDAAGDIARQLLADVLAAPRGRTKSRPLPVRRLAIGGVLTGAAVAAAVLMFSSSDGSRVGPAGYTVDRDTRGTVHAVVRWSALSDPAALQAALDRAGARTKVFVETHTGSEVCRPDVTTVPYSVHAVRWQSPDDANAENGIVLRPDEFPAGGTFVLIVDMAPAGSTHGSTFAPGFPQITGTLSFMAIGHVSEPVCG